MAVEVVRSRRGFFGPVGWERVTWSGVAAGLVMAVATHMLMGLLGMAIGVTALIPADGAAAEAFGWGAAIWTLVSMAVALGVGGYVAGRFAASTSGASGAMNGALVWALAFVFAGYLVLSGVGALVGGAFGLVGQAAQAEPMDQARMERIEQMAREAGIDVDQVRRQIEQATERVGTAGREDAAAAAERAAGYTAAALWLLFGGSLLGLFIAAWAGGRGQLAGMKYLPPETTVRRAA